MAQAVKKVIVARGRDPRDFILASFGGAGAMHACFVADSMNIPRIIVPREAGVASAFGATAMDLRHDLEAFYFSPVADAEVATINRMYEQLEKDAIALLEADGLKAADVQLSRSAQMRYVGQSYEVETPIPSGKLTAADLPAIASNFHQCHEMEFGVSSDDFAPAIVSLGVTVVGKIARPPVQQIDVAGREPIKGQRQVYFDRAWHASNIYDGHALAAGATVEGPCIVEYEHACAVLPPNAAGTVDAYGNMMISLS